MANIVAGRLAEKSFGLDLFEGRPAIWTGWVPSKICVKALRGNLDGAKLMLPALRGRRSSTC